MRSRELTRKSDSGNRFEAERVARAFLWRGEAVRETGPETATWTDEYVALIGGLSDRELSALEVLNARVGRLLRRRYTRLVGLMRRDCEWKRVTRYLAKQGAPDLADKLRARCDAIVGRGRPVDPRSQVCAELAARGFAVPEIVSLLEALRLEEVLLEETDGDPRAVQRRIDRARARAPRPSNPPAWSPEERRTVRAAIDAATADLKLSLTETARLLMVLDLLDPASAEDAALLALPAFGPDPGPGSPARSVAA